MKKLCLLVVIMIMGIGSSFAYLPQRVIDQQLESAQIKALVQVKDIIKTSCIINGMQITDERVIFQCVKKFSKKVPGFFEGVAIFSRYKNPETGEYEGRDTVFHHPKVGQKALVFVDQLKGGSIVTYIPLDDELFEQLKNEQLKNLNVTLRSVSIKK